MTRREILKYTALATGTAIATPLVTSLFSGCKPDVAKLPNYKPLFFDENQFSILKKLVDIILPKTDSPAATEVGVQNIIDTMLAQVYTSEEQVEYKKGFQNMLEYLNGGAEQMEEVASKLSLEKLQQLITSTDEAAKPAKDAFSQLRQQTVAYYLSTEEIGKNYLNYLPVPGEYEACIQLSDVGGKAWAI